MECNVRSSTSSSVNNSRRRIDDAGASLQLEHDGCSRHGDIIQYSLHLRRRRFRHRHLHSSIHRTSSSIKARINTTLRVQVDNNGRRSIRNCNRSIPCCARNANNVLHQRMRVLRHRSNSFIVKNSFRVIHRLNWWTAMMKEQKRRERRRRKEKKCEALLVRSRC